MDPLISELIKKDEIKKNLKTEVFGKGEIIMRPHSTTKYIHVIKSGLVKVYSLDSRGKENIAIIYGPGDMFPLAWIIDAERPSVYFKAINECTIQLIPIKAVDDLVKNKSELYFKLIHRVVKQFALFASTINNLGFKYGRERLSYRLLVMAHRFGEKKNGKVVIPYINHEDLGHTINMTRESVNKEISRLEKSGIINYNRTAIIINDMKGLQKEVGHDVPVIFFSDF